MDFQNPIAPDQHPPQICTKDLSSILKLTPGQRKTKHLSILQTQFQNISFIKDLTKEIGDTFIKDFCSVVSYEYIESGCAVFDYGSTGSKFYIIIEGTVGILIPSKKDNNEDPVFIEVSKLSSGKAFGELALIKDQPRMATIKCLTDCHFAVLNKNDYLRMIGKFEKKKLDDLIIFLKGIPLFSIWTKTKLEKLTYLIKSVKYYRKQTVFHLGDPGNFVYIVKSGEFELTQPLKNFAGNAKKEFLVKVALLTSGEVLGEKEVFFARNYSVSCSCYSTAGELLVISKEHFLMNFDKNSSYSEYFESQNDKYRIREKRLENFEQSLKDVFGAEKVKKNEQYERKKLLTRAARPASVEKSPKRVRLLSKNEIKVIKKRALPRHCNRNSTPVSVYTRNEMFLTYCPVMKREKVSEMVPHRPGGYYRGKLKSPKTACKSIDAILC